MTRIESNDSKNSAVMKISDGDTGAITVCMRLLREGGDIDTDDILDGFGSILLLDTFGIYGSSVWMLYNDVCNEDLSKMIAVLRACQLREISILKLNHAINNTGDGLDVDSCVEFVKGRLNGFKI